MTTAKKKPGVRYTPEQRKKIIAQIDKAIAGGKLTIEQACAKAGISNPSYYNWKGRTSESLAIARNRQADLVKRARELKTALDTFIHAAEKFGRSLGNGK